MSGRRKLSPLARWRREAGLTARDVAYAATGSSYLIADTISILRLLEHGIDAGGQVGLWGSLPGVVPDDVLRAHLDWLAEHGTALHEQIAGEEGR